MKKILILAITLFMLFGIVACSSGEEDVETTETTEQVVEEQDEIKKEQENNEQEESKGNGEVDLDLTIQERDFAIGKSDKNFLDIEVSEPTSIRNDVTEKWRKTMIAEPVDINEYILSYNKLYMEDDITAVHVIFNFTYNTTTMINDIGPYVGVKTYEYVEDEEHDAKKIGEGLLLGEYNIYKDNGDIVDFEKAVEAEENNN